jgi:hypothetical protein
VDARNCSSNTLDVPSVGAYGVEPDQTIRQVIADREVPDEAIEALLEQTDVWVSVGGDPAGDASQPATGREPTADTPADAGDDSAPPVKSRPRRT